MARRFNLGWLPVSLSLLAGVAWHAAPAAASDPAPASPLIGIDGTWTFLCLNRIGEGAVYDSGRDRLVTFGGIDFGGTHNEVWTLSLSGCHEWTKLTPTGEPPSPRHGHSVIYDPVGDRIVVFGGFADATGRFNDVWALSLSKTPAWTELTPDGTPPGPRDGHSASYDPTGGRMIVFGGQADRVWDDDGRRNDVWSLSLTGTPTWTLLSPLGTPPSVRRDHSAIHDPMRQRMVVFGGSGPSNEVWALSLAGTPVWSSIAPAGTPPAANERPRAVYDPIRDRMLVFGGVTGGPDLWALSLAASPTWTAISPGGAPPGLRNGHGAIYDPPRDRMVVCGGSDMAGYPRYDAWALSLTEGPVWENVTADVRPGARYMQSAMHDAARRRMLVFGGSIGYRHPSNDVWALALVGPPVWTQVTPSGTPPSPRYGQSAILDPVRDRIVVFGGGDGAGSNDVWALSLGESPEWTELTPTGGPPDPRTEHTAIYDPVRDRMIVFGGEDRGFLNDVWALSLGESPEWTLLAPTGGPPDVRAAHSAIYDPVRDRMVIFGGITWFLENNDAWALSFSGGEAWQPLVPAGSPPGPRYGHVAIYDSIRDRIVVFGGGDYDPQRYYSSVFKDMFALELSAGPSWTKLEPAGGWPWGPLQGSAIFNPARDQMVVLGGQNGTGIADAGLWSVCFNGGTLAVEPRATPVANRLHPPTPSPARERVSLELELPRSARASVGIFDLSGRRVRTLVEGVLTPGTHTLQWDAKDGSGRKLKPGVYFCAAVVGDERLRRAIVLVR